MDGQFQIFNKLLIVSECEVAVAEENSVTAVYIQSLYTFEL